MGAALALQGLLRLVPAPPGGALAEVLPALSFFSLVGPAWWAAQRRGHDPLRAHGLLVPLRGLPLALLVTGGVLLAFVGGAALLAGLQGLAPRTPPWQDAGLRFVADALFVALPEEWLFRGVLQPALDPPEGPRRRVLGAPLGRGALLAALLFGLAHALLWLAPARLLTAGPGLLFGWVRARTGGVLPAVLVHAASNATLELVQGTWPRLELPGVG